MTVDPRTAWIITLSVAVGILFTFIFGALYQYIRIKTGRIDLYFIPLIILAILAVIFIIAASAEIAKLS